jgi:hypothetical protein
LHLTVPRVELYIDFTTGLFWEYVFQKTEAGFKNMRKLVVALVTAVVLLGFVSGLLLFQLNAFQSLNNELAGENAELKIRNGDLEDQIEQFTNRVNITAFAISGFRPVEEWIVWESDVTVKIENFGINDVEGLKLEIVGFGDERLAEILQLGALHVGEEREIHTNAQWGYGSYGTSVATLLLNDSVLDVCSLEFSEVYPAH